ncbi:unnamed protein product [Heterobilharzia americana]|nr:unnamed protein product [Heterobilharzia americana]
MKWMPIVSNYCSKNHPFPCFLVLHLAFDNCDSENQPRHCYTFHALFQLSSDLLHNHSNVSKKRAKLPSFFHCQNFNQ